MTSLYEHVAHIRKLIQEEDWTNGMTPSDYGSEEEYEEANSAWGWLSDVLDIDWVCYHDKTYKGARLWVALGGPNICVNTTTNEVEGYWLGEKPVKLYYGSNSELDEAARELFECT
jgi:hypothetical protein